MQLDLVRGRLVRRYQRFFADVVLDDGRLVTAHCPNTGSMATLLAPDAIAWLRPAASATRRLAWTLVLLGTAEGGLALVDTALPNRVVADGIAAGAVAELAGYGALRREVRYGSRGSRIDLLLEPAPGDPRGPCHVEIKSVTMAAAEGRADFPDAVTARGLKHLHELADLARAGGRVVQFYLVGRTDRVAAGIAGGIDPAYAQALLAAVAAGVEVIAYRAAITSAGIGVGQRCAFAPPGLSLGHALA